MNWLKTELLTGFQKLLCLGLDRTPASEVIPGTVEAWSEVLLTGNYDWQEDRDVSRFRAAFLTMARTRRTWPAPADFLEALPERDTRQWKALPKAEANPEVVKKVWDAAKEAFG
jgi:hypothetical protein